MGVCGRVLESTQTTGGQSYTMAYGYDRAGNLTSQRYPSDRVVDYVYDGAGRIAGAKTGADGWYAGGTGSNAVGYEPHGGVKQLLLGNGLWEQRRYNARLQPTQIGLGTTQAAGSLTATGMTPSASLPLLDYSYGATANNGNVLSQRIRVGASLNQNQVYTYDALNRLKTAGETGSGTAWSQTYAYDRYGNRRVTAGASHGSNQALTPQSTADIAAGTNRLAGLKGVNTVAYDAAGNLKADWAANAFKYDGDNRLVAFDHPTGTDSDTTYAYDGEGRRVRKVVGGSGGTATTYVYNVLGQLVAEFGGTASEQPGTRYLTPDSLGSTRVVTAEDQSVLSRHDYLPFGEEIGSGLGNRDQAAGYTASLTDGPAQKFTGKERDNESGLDYFGARYFSGAGGRFTSVDPENAGADLANPQSWNGYSYVLNRPLNLIDPTGEQWVPAEGGTYDWNAFLEELRRSELELQPVFCCRPSGANEADQPKAEADVDSTSYYNIGLDVLSVLLVVADVVLTPALPGDGLYLAAMVQGGKGAVKREINKQLRREAKKKLRKKPGKPGQSKSQDALRRTNKQAKDAARQEGLNREQRRRLHDEISGKGYTYQQLREVARKIKEGTK